MGKSEESIRYFSLDEAREEIKKRWNNIELRKRIEEELSNNFIDFFKSDKPRSVLFRQMVSPDNGFYFFQQEAKYLDTKPTVVEYLEDIFVSFNEEKKGYGRLYVNNNYIDIINFYDSEKKTLKDIITIRGEKLFEFHHKLMEETKLDFDIFDNSDWFKSLGKAKDYYYQFLLHFICHGVLFENFVLDEENINENVFTINVVLPAIKKIEDKFGLRPLIVKMYPDGQTMAEDLYWWSYPYNISKKILDFLHN